jgi:hypothetical protein
MVAGTNNTYPGDGQRYLNIEEVPSAVSSYLSDGPCHSVSLQGEMLTYRKGPHKGTMAVNVERGSQDCEGSSVLSAQRQHGVWG